MDKNDKLLAAIIAGIAVLVVAAFIMAVRQPPPEYRSGSAPEDVAHNYLLAVERGDYERAYSYLSPTVAGYPPTLEVFVDEASSFAGQDGPGSASTTAVQPATVTGERALVEVRRTSFSESGLFESRQDTSDHVVRLENAGGGAWLISHSDLYWHYCWDRPTECRDRPIVKPKPPGAYP